jgi:hypothetical protein
MNQQDAHLHYDTRCAAGESMPAKGTTAETSEQEPFAQKTTVMARFLARVLAPEFRPPEKSRPRVSVP